MSLMTFLFSWLMILHGLSDDGEESFDDDFDKIGNSVSFTYFLIHFPFITFLKSLTYASP